MLTRNTLLFIRLLRLQRTPATDFRLQELATQGEPDPFARQSVAYDAASHNNDGGNECSLLF